MTLTQDRLFIDGEWVTPAGTERITTINPANEDAAGSIPAGTHEDIDRAVAAARGAFERGDWRNLRPSERADVLRRVSAELTARGKDMAHVLVSEMGSPISQALFGQMPGTVDILDYYISEADSFPWQTRKPTFDAMNKDLDVVVQQFPIGVVAAITPWNGPQIVTMMKVAPALMAGCSVVIKPAPESTLNFVGFAEAFEAAGLPKGVLNIVTGGVDAGVYLVEHPDVDKVAFTGSSANGRKIAIACAQRLRSVTLELGGKSAAVILEDADLDLVMSTLLPSMLFVSGQACNSHTRFLAPRSRYDEVVDAFAAALDQIPLGDPTDPDTYVGPMTTPRQLEKVMDYIEIGKNEGAKLVRGGGRPAGHDKGWWVEKTLFRDVDNRMRIAQEEIFGPVFTVIPFDSEDDAIRIANDNVYGLASSVWSADAQHGFEVASQVRAGSMGVNAYNLDAAAPLAGFRDSGIGVERGIEAMYEYLIPKGILVRKADGVAA